MKYKTISMAFLVVACRGDGFSTASGLRKDGGPRGSDGGNVGQGGRPQTGGRASSAGASNGDASTGGVSNGGASNTGGVNAAGVSNGGAVSSTGGLPSSGGSGGSPSNGGVPSSGGSGGSGGTWDGGPPITCLTDLSGVADGDFSIHFTLTTTVSGLYIGLLRQRVGCSEASTFWEITLSPTAGIVASTGDGIAAHLVFVAAGNSLNDGKPHKVDVIRQGGRLWYASDGTINSAQTPNPYAFGTFPPLVLGSSECPGFVPASGHVTISDVCLTRP